MKLFEKLKWHRIGYIEGTVRMSETATFTARSILYVREPFLWFRTRKTVEIGDFKAIENGLKSEHYRQYKRDRDDWLLGGKINYVSDNGTDKPAEIIKLVK